MLVIISWWEFALACGVLVLAAIEVVGLLLARRAGLTKNVSRLVSHGSLVLLSALYAWLAIWWSEGFEASATDVVGTRFGIANWGFLILAGMLAVVVYEVVAQVWAMHIGYTRSVPRLVIKIAMAIVVALMFMMNLTRWQVYRDGILEGSAAVGASGGLLQTAGWWELALVLGVLLLATAEFVGLVAARRAGETVNPWRLVLYGLLAGLATTYSYIEVRWPRGLEAEPLTVGAHPAIADWGLVILAGILFLALFALATVAWARRFGISGSSKRLVNHVVMAALVIVIVAINLTRWQMYFGMLEESYLESIRPASGSGE